MENMIKRIVEMDQKARQITEAAQREKLDSEKEIAEKAAQLRADYLERARRRIQLNSDTERAAAEKAWEAREVEYTRQTERLEGIYREHRDEWVDTIVRNVLDA